MFSHDRNRRRSEISQQDIELAKKNVNDSTPEPENDETAEIDDSESAALIPNDALQNSTEHAQTNTYISNHTVEDTDFEISTNLDSTLTQTVQDRITSTVNHEVPAQTYTANASLESKELSTCNDVQNGVGNEASTGIVEMSEDADLEGGSVAIRSTGGRRLSWGQIPSQKAVKSSLRNHCIYLKLVCLIRSMHVPTPDLLCYHTAVYTIAALLQATGILTVGWHWCIFRTNQLLVCFIFLHSHAHTACSAILTNFRIFFHTQSSYTNMKLAPYVHCRVSLSFSC